MGKSIKANSLNQLFLPDVRHVSVVNNRGYHAPQTDMLAFGYPEDRYGFLVSYEIAIDEIPDLIRLYEAKGFELAGIHDDNKTRSFTYKIPGSKWWTDFVKPGTILT